MQEPPKKKPQPADSTGANPFADDSTGNPFADDNPFVDDSPQEPAAPQPEKPKLGLVSALGAAARGFTQKPR